MGWPPSFALASKGGTRHVDIRNNGILPPFFLLPDIGLENVCGTFEGLWGTPRRPQLKWRGPGPCYKHAMGMYLGCFGIPVGYIERPYIQFGLTGLCSQNLFFWYGPERGLSGQNLGHVVYASGRSIKPNWI